MLNKFHVDNILVILAIVASTIALTSMILQEVLKLEDLQPVRKHVCKEMFLYRAVHPVKINKFDRQTNIYLFCDT